METGAKVIVREKGAFFGMEGVIESMPEANLKGPGFDISVPEEHQKATVKIQGCLGIFVRLTDLELA